MERKGTLLYTNPWDFKVYGVITRDINSKRVSLDIYTLSPEDEMSDIVTISRKDIYTKEKSFLDFFYDVEGDFGREDIDKIKTAVKDFIKKSVNVEELQNKATIAEIHHAVSSYIRMNAEELEDNSQAEVFIKDNFGYILTSQMDKFVSENKELGYKRVDILKRLKILGALQPGNNRPYDALVSVGGEKRRYYKIELTEIPKEENADEEVDVCL